MSSTKFGNVTFSLGSASMARLMAKVAPSLRAQLRRAMPLFTSQCNMQWRRRSAHAEAAVDDFTPAYATAVVDAHPGGSAETVADDVLHSHVGGERRAIVDVGSLTERAVGARDVVVVAAEDDGTAQAAVSDGLVELGSDLRAAFAVGVEDTGLRTYHEVVLLCATDPLDVVAHLLLDFRRSGAGNVFKHFAGDVVGDGQVFRLARGADPTEGGPKP